MNFSEVMAISVAGKNILTATKGKVTCCTNLITNIVVTRCSYMYHVVRSVWCQMLTCSINIKNIGVQLLKDYQLNSMLIFKLNYSFITPTNKKYVSFVLVFIIKFVNSLFIFFSSCFRGLFLFLWGLNWLICFV